MDPPSDQLSYATLRRTSDQEHFMNLSYLDRDVEYHNLSR
jgi:hypothetical protein